VASQEIIELLRKSAREFLEDAPLFKRVRAQLPSPVASGQDPFPASLGRECETCQQRTTWKRVEGEGPNHFEKAALVAYRCADCGTKTLASWVRVTRFDEKPIPVLPRSGMTLGNSPHTVTVAASSEWEFMKIGQSELPAPRMSRDVARLLGDEAQYYKKALACLGEGFGLGACAYLRRIIENRTNALLDRIADVVAADGDEATKARIDGAMKSPYASDRLKVAAEVLPSWLRPGGANPLAILFGAFSDELHSGTREEDALTRAQDLCKAFEFLVTRMTEHLADAQRFRESVLRESQPKPPPKAE
jgi:hypothetical protein